MYGTYFHNWSRSQDTAYRKFRRILGILRLQGLWRSSGRIFPIFASQIKAVCHEVQMHFFSYPPPKFTKMFWVHFWDFHFASKKIKTSGRIFSIFASKSEGISSEVQTHFGSSLPASFTEKVIGEISPVMHPKTKRFAVKFRRILEALCLAKFIKNFLDAFSRFFRPKVKLFAVGFRCILDVLCLQGLQ